ncbi:DivIVA domain-containing protein [Amycolatopsis magusensis]|uniref:DivIVA domain-containing protein n=1 Tax=Amycolatopsis magusensis TaxID=882444 RepID=UPI003791C3DB
MSLSADDARRVAFANAPIGRRGYAKPEVDEFVRRIAGTLDGQDDLTAAEVHHVLFGRPLIGKRGYDEREVDEFLDSAEEALASHLGTDWRTHQVPAARDASQATDARARSAPADQYSER